MADLRFNNKNNQKKTASVFASGPLTSADSGTLFTLPEASYVTAITVIDVAGGVGEGTVAGIAAATYYPTGAAVTISGVTETEKVIVEYIETELTNGQYTD